MEKPSLCVTFPNSHPSYEPMHTRYTYQPQQLALIDRTRPKQYSPFTTSPTPREESIVFGAIVSRQLHYVLDSFPSHLQRSTDKRTGTKRPPAGSAMKGVFPSTEPSPVKLLFILFKSLNCAYCKHD